MQAGALFAVFTAGLVFTALVSAQSKLSHEQIIAYLDAMRQRERGMMNVQPVEGEYLSNLVRKLNAKRVLEIGTSNGYSGSWLALGLRETGGRLITLEIDEGRHSLAVRNFKATGLEDVIDSRLTDALKEIPRIPGPFDLVFIDAWKPDYIKYLQLVLPKVRAGGVIVAHNVESQASEMRDFLEAIRTNPQLETQFVRLTASGFSVSTKK